MRSFIALLALVALVLSGSQGCVAIVHAKVTPGTGKLVVGQTAQKEAAKHDKCSLWGVLGFGDIKLGCGITGAAVSDGATLLGTAIVPVLIEEVGEYMSSGGTTTTNIYQLPEGSVPPVKKPADPEPDS